VARFLNRRRNENLADFTLDQLTTIFEKQFLAWATSYGFTHITEITTADLEGFRDTWTDGTLAKKKKQERLIVRQFLEFFVVLQGEPSVGRCVPVFSPTFCPKATCAISRQVELEQTRALAGRERVLFLWV